MVVKTFLLLSIALSTPWSCKAKQNDHQPTIITTSKLHPSFQGLAIDSPRKRIMFDCNTSAQRIWSSHFFVINEKRTKTIWRWHKQNTIKTKDLILMYCRCIWTNHVLLKIFSFYYNYLKSCIKGNMINIIGWQYKTLNTGNVLKLISETNSIYISTYFFMGAQESLSLLV